MSNQVASPLIHWIFNAVNYCHSKKTRWSSLHCSTDCWLNWSSFLNSYLIYICLSIFFLQDVSQYLIHLWICLLVVFGLMMSIIRCDLKCGVDSFCVCVFASINSFFEVFFFFKVDFLVITFSDSFYIRSQHILYQNTEAQLLQPRLPCCMSSYFLLQTFYRTSRLKWERLWTNISLITG